MQFEFEALPTVMFFKKGDVKGAPYEGEYDKSKINDFVNEARGRPVEKIKVNTVLRFIKNH